MILPVVHGDCQECPTRERLEAEIELLRDRIMHAHKVIDQDTEEIERLRASNAELLAALKNLLEWIDDNTGRDPPQAEAARAAIAKAEARATSFVSEHGEGEGYG